MTEKTDRTGKGFRKLLVWQRAHLILAQDLTYITPSQFKQAESLRAETGFLLHRLIESLDRK